MAEQNGSAGNTAGNPRPNSNSYPSPSPNSYPSPSMQSYQYPPPQTQVNNEPYRQSPSGASASLPSINLPPIRGMDGQPPAQSPLGPHPSGVGPMPPPAPQMYYQPNMPHPGQIGMPPAPHMIPGRYPIPAQGASPGMIPGRPQKKDIKRRTKTGCLTCRKRRIKCDEQHPKCRNCIKSKRECLGYDPIFKQQQGPQQLQPAPSASPASSSSTVTSGPPVNASAPPQPYPPPPTASYPPHSNAPPASSAPSSSYEFSSAIDPALASTDSKPMASQANTFNPTPVGAQPSSAGGPLKVEQLFWIGGITPPELPASPAPLDQNALNEIRTMYINEFAPGLNSFFETRWYSSAGVERLMLDTEMCHFMSELIKRYKTITQGADYHHETLCRVLETKAVWKLATMCRHPPAAANGANGTAPTSNLEMDELNKRVDIIEHLLTKSTAPSNPVTILHYPTNLPEEAQSAIKFWRIVGDFVSLRLDDNANGSKFDGILAACRACLNRLENRDVIYSILVTRHVGRRVPGFPDSIQATDPRAGEADDTNRVALAKEFVASEAQWKGTTHPIQRLCDMAVRSWALR